LTCHRDGFAAELTAHGYTDLSAANQLRLMADLSRWLEAEDVGLDRVDRDVVDRFLAKRRRTHTQFLTDRALLPLLRYLESAAAIRGAAPERRPRRGILVEYERYLVEERAVGPGRLAVCLAVATEFLAGKRIAALKAADVTRFVDARAGRPGLMGCLSGLRSLLRYLFASSKIARNLVYAVPSVMRWRQQSLPQALEPHELQAVLATCDRRSVIGCRDYAVLLLLGRLGLRAGEVAALKLDDIDWSAGELTIRGKGRTLGRLPLPVDIGEALVSQLRRAVRSKTTRAVVVRCRAPYGSMMAGAITAIARRALRAAGIPRGSAHRFRHTAATQMLRRGATSTEIAQVLRHRHVDTTAIYAKVDRDSLRSIAKPWPADAPDRELVRALAQRWPGGVP
jgi:integrase